MNKIKEYLVINENLNDIILSIINDERILLINDRYGDHEEVQNILEYFNEFILDTNNLKSDLIEILNYDNDDYIENYKRKLIVLNREIYNTRKNILDIFNCFLERDKCGYSLNELYNITEKAIEFKDEKFEYYNILNKCETIRKSTFNELTNELNILLKEGFIGSFIKYKKFENNERFDIIEKSITNKDIDEVINKLDGILNNTFAFIPPLYFNEYTDEFINQKIYYNNYSEVQLKEVSREINYKINGKLLNGVKKYSKFNLQYWKNYKSINDNNSAIYDKYLSLENKIFNQYKENIENVDIYINSFKFINRTFKDSVYEKVYSIVLNEDELYSYILFLKNTLNIYREYLSLENKIKLMNSFQYNLLNYCYINIENKNQLGDLIKFIPMYCSYLNIEDIERSKSNILSKYNYLNKYIININKILGSYTELIILFLRKKIINNIILNNKISKKDLLSKLESDNESEYINNVILNSYPLLIIDNSNEKKVYDYENLLSKFDKKYFLDDILSVKENKIQTEQYIFNEFIYNSEYLNNKINGEIFKILTNWGYSLMNFGNLNIYISSDKSKNSLVIDINNIDKFTNNDLVDIIKLKEKYSYIIFIWYRDWWISINEEVVNLNKQLSKYF